MTLKFRNANKLIAVLVMLSIFIMPFMAGKALANSLVDDKILIKTVPDTISSKILNSTSVQEEIHKLSIDYKLNVDKAVIRQSSKLTGEQYLVVVPINDNTGYSFSKAVLVYDQKYNFKELYLYIYNKIENNNYEFQCITPSSSIKAEVAEDGSIIGGTVNNGDEKLDLTTTLQSKGWQIGKGTTEVAPLSVSSFWECFSNCMANEGIPSWVISTIATVCAAACVISAGAGCLVCIGALTFGTSFNFGGCFASCY